MVTSGDNQWKPVERLGSQTKTKMNKIEGLVALATVGGRINKYGEVSVGGYASATTEVYPGVITRV